MRVVRVFCRYWNRSGGRDHVFVFPGARGPTIFKEWETHIKQSIFLTPEGDRKAAYFNTWKDIVIPGLEADQNFVDPENRAELENEFGTPKKYAQSTLQLLPQLSLSLPIFEKRSLFTRRMQEDAIK